MNSINTNNQHFTAKIVSAEDLGNKTFRKACREFSRLSADDNSTMYVWKNGDRYEFGLAERPVEPTPITQAVGRDVFGYFFMESDYKDLAKFLRTTLNVLKSRIIHKNSFINADVEAAFVYTNDKHFGDMIARTNNGFIDFQKIGECVHFSE